MRKGTRIKEIIEIGERGITVVRVGVVTLAQDAFGIQGVVFMTLFVRLHHRMVQDAMRKQGVEILDEIGRLQRDLTQDAKAKSWPSPHNDP